TTWSPKLVTRDLNNTSTCARYAASIAGASGLLLGFGMMSSYWSAGSKIQSRARRLRHAIARAARGNSASCREGDRSLQSIVAPKTFRGDCGRRRAEKAELARGIGRLLR